MLKLHHTTENAPMCPLCNVPLVKSSLCSPESSKYTVSENTQITWEEAAHLCLSSLNPLAALKLLKSVNLHHGALSQKFFDTAIQYAFAAKNPSAASNYDFGRLDSQLWASKTSAVPPDVVCLIEQEKKGDVVLLEDQVQRII